MIDYVEVLTRTDRARKYWADLKKRLQSEGSELSEKVVQLKMLIVAEKQPHFSATIVIFGVGELRPKSWTQCQRV